jgi:hypothetical protein
VPQSRSGRSGEDKILALTGSNLSFQHACRRCKNCAIPTPVILVITKPMALRIS